MRIGIDIMGGDYAPAETVKGAILAAGSLPADISIVLIGDSDIIRDELKKNNQPEDRLEIINASQEILMAEHPTKAIQQKPD